MINQGRTPPNMLASIPFSRRTLAIWLCAFLSPSVYFLLLLLADSFHFGLRIPEAFVASLFLLIPACALLVCESVVWSARMTTARKIGWMLFTLLAIFLQSGIIIAIVIAATGYAPTM